MSDYYAVIRFDSYLAHHGVKGMKWGVRKSYESFKKSRQLKANAKEQAKLKSMAPEARNRYLAKKEYKSAKKEYNKAFNRYVRRDNNPINWITDSGRRKIEKDYATTLVKSSNFNIAKGKYIKAKGLASNNKKKVAKGKHLVDLATNSKKYNDILLKDIENGYTFSESRSRNRETYNNLLNNERDIDARYRREKRSFK